VITASSVVRRRAEVAVRSTPQGALIVDFKTGRCWQLNQIGADFLQGIEAETSVGEVCEQLQCRYTVAPEVLSRDLCRLAQDLVEAGLIERVGG
jgi:hypothetical protein